jgi:putative membrane protein
MNIYASHETVTFFPWPFLLIPLIFWATFVFFVMTARRRFRGRSGESTLRHAFATGEVTEAEYRDRLAVLKETRR